MKRILNHRAVLASYWLFCFAATHLPVPESISLDNGRDKILHFIGYFILAFLFCYQARKREQTPSLMVKEASLWLPLYAAVDEITQPFVGRTCEWQDWLVDFAAILLAIFITLRFFGGDRKTHPTQSPP